MKKAVCLKVNIFNFYFCICAPIDISRKPHQTLHNGVNWGTFDISVRMFKTRVTHSMHIADWVFLFSTVLPPVTLKAPRMVLPGSSYRTSARARVQNRIEPFNNISFYDLLKMLC